MNAIQKTALKETAKTLLGLTAIGIAIPAAIFLIPIEVLGVIVSLALLGMGAKMIYDTKLAQAKFDAERNNPVD
jgi:hypothetical protein